MRRVGALVHGGGPPLARQAPQRRRVDVPAADQQQRRAARLARHLRDEVARHGGLDARLHGVEIAVGAPHRLLAVHAHQHHLRAGAGAHSAQRGAGPPGLEARQLGADVVSHAGQQAAGVAEGHHDVLGQGLRRVDRLVHQQRGVARVRRRQALLLLAPLPHAAPGGPRGGAQLGQEVVQPRVRGPLVVLLWGCFSPDSKGEGERGWRGAGVGWGGAAMRAEGRRARRPRAAASIIHAPRKRCWAAAHRRKRARLEDDRAGGRALGGGRMPGGHHRGVLLLAGLSGGGSPGEGVKRDDGADVRHGC